jgi:hypothetical protein
MDHTVKLVFTERALYGFLIYEIRASQGAFDACAASANNASRRSFSSGL